MAKRLINTFFGHNHYLLSSAYAFESFDDLERYHANKLDETRYGRDSSGISMQCEYYFDRIFDCQKSFLASSGMSAINLAFNSLVDNKRNHINLLPKEYFI